MANRNIEPVTGEIFVPGAAPGSPVEGQVYYDSTEHALKIRGASTWGSAGVTPSMGAFGSTPNANGGTFAAGVLTLQPASPVFPGGVTTTAQTFAGSKTFDQVVVSSGSNIAVSGTSTSNYGISGTSSSSAGVSGQSTTGYGVVAQSSSNYGIYITINATKAPLHLSGQVSAPTSAAEGDIFYDSTNHSLKFYNATAWIDCGSPPLSMGTFGSSPNANGGTISAGVLTLQPASASFPGGISAADFVKLSNLSGTNSGNVTLTAIGSTPNANGASLSGQALNLQPADATYGGVVTTTTQSFTGAKTFNSTVTLATTGLVNQSGTDSSGTPGNATINKPTGISAIASGSSTCTITNSLVTTGSRVMITWYGDHGASRSWVVRAAGSFTVTLPDGASANTSFGWEVSTII